MCCRKLYSHQRGTRTGKNVCLSSVLDVLLTDDLHTTYEFQKDSPHYLLRTLWPEDGNMNFALILAKIS